jgi:5-formyltetrahydrofolate cyclo-ligase
MTAASITKSRLRRQIRDRRRDRTAAERAQADTVIGELAAALLSESPRLSAGPSLVAAYQSTTAEPGTRGLRHQAHRMGIPLALPVITSAPALDDAGSQVAALRWIRDDADLMATGPGMLTDASLTATGITTTPIDASAPEVIFLPALAVDAAGTRLGQGGGYYDRYLAELLTRPKQPMPPTQPMLVAIVYDDEFVDATGEPLPRESHDIPVHAAITPAGIRRCDPTAFTGGDRT